MLRLNEIKLPLDHSDEDLAAAVAARLGLKVSELAGWQVFRRSYDARRKTAIQLSYQVDVTLDPDRERALLAAQPALAGIGPSPDTRYHFVASAGPDFPRASQQRPLVIGFGPCGILAALLLALAANGIEAKILEDGMHGWRRELFGNIAVGLKQGKLMIGIRKGRPDIFEA